MMRIFVAGTSGGTGARLVPQFIDHWHKVIGIYESPGNTERARAFRAEPIALDQQPARVWCRIAGGC
jgi:nucleoside-diphosphate-sugar epimerase